MGDERDSKSIAQKATETYRLYKEKYKLSQKELILIENITGIDTYALQLKDKLANESKDKNFNKEQRIDLYKKRIQDEIERRKAYNAQPWYRKFSTGLQDKSFTDLEQQLKDSKLDLFTNNLSALIEGYIQSIDAKITAIQEENAKRFFFSPFIKSTAHLEATKEFLQYHRTLRDDLIHPSKRLSEKQHAPVEKTLKSGFLKKIKQFFSGFFSSNSALTQLMTVHKKKTEQVERYIKKINLPEEEIANALQTGGQNLVANYTIDEQKGYVQFALFKNEQTTINSLAKKLEFPAELKEYIGKINPYIQLGKELQSLITKLKSLESGKSTTESSLKEDIKKRISSIQEHIKTLLTNDAGKKEICKILGDIQRKCSKDTPGSSDVEKAIQPLLILTPNDIVKKPDFISGDKLSDATLNQLLDQEGDNEKGSLGSLTIKRAIFNVAILDTTRFERDEVANELNNAVAKILTVKTSDFNRTEDADFNNFKDLQKKEYFINDPEKKNTTQKYFTEMDSLIKTNLILLTTQFHSFLNSSKDIPSIIPNHTNDPRSSLQRIGSGIKTMLERQAYLLSPVLKTQQEYLRIFQTRLTQLYAAHKKAKSEEDPITVLFKELVDQFEPQQGLGDKRDHEERYTDFVKNTLQAQSTALSEMVLKLQKTKQAVKYLGGQLSYKFEGEAFSAPAPH